MALTAADLRTRIDEIDETIRATTADGAASVSLGDRSYTRLSPRQLSMLRTRYVRRLNDLESNGAYRWNRTMRFVDPDDMAAAGGGG